MVDSSQRLTSAPKDVVGVTPNPPANGALAAQPAQKVNTYSIGSLRWAAHSDQYNSNLYYFLHSHEDTV